MSTEEKNRDIIDNPALPRPWRHLRTAGGMQTGKYRRGGEGRPPSKSKVSGHYLEGNVRLEVSFVLR